MLLDTVDQFLLSFVATHRFIRPADVKRFGFAAEFEAGIDVLLRNGLLSSFGKKKEYVCYNSKAAKLALRHGITAEGVRRMTHDDPRPPRYSRYAAIALTCLRAGIDAASNSLDAMAAQPSFITSLPLRDGKEKHLVSTSQCAGFGRWQHTLYIVFSPTKESSGIMAKYETSLVYSIPPLFGAPFDTPGVIVLAGESYEDIYEVISQPQVQNPNGSITYSKAFADLTLPIQLLSCDETGAMQLAITRQATYKARLLNAVIGADLWSPPNEGLDVDAIVDGVPLILAVDMDVRRVLESIKVAQTRGHDKVYVVALREQVAQFWERRLPRKGVELFAFPFEAVSLGKSLYTPVREPAQVDGRLLIV